MKNEINVWKVASLILLIISLGLGYSLYRKNNPSQVISITEMSNESFPVDYSENFKTDEVPDGEGLYSMAGVLRIDGSLVDDQYFAYLWPEEGSSTDGAVALEIANDAKIKIFKDLNVESGTVISVDLNTFRGLTRNLEKDIKSWTVFYKIKIKDNLIESIEQVKR